MRYAVARAPCHALFSKRFSSLLRFFCFTCRYATCSELYRIHASVRQRRLLPGMSIFSFSQSWLTLLESLSLLMPRSAFSGYAMISSWFSIFLFFFFDGFSFETPSIAPPFEILPVYGESVDFRHFFENNDATGITWRFLHRPPSQKSADFHYALLQIAYVHLREPRHASFARPRWRGAFDCSSQPGRRAFHQFSAPVAVKMLYAPPPRHASSLRASHIFAKILKACHASSCITVFKMCAFIRFHSTVRTNSSIEARFDVSYTPSASSAFF